MKTEEQVWTVLVETNPVPDVNQYGGDEVGGAAYLATLEPRSSEVTQLDTEQTEPTSPKRSMVPWLIAAGLAAVIGVAVIIASLNGEQAPVVDEPTPTTVVDATPTTTAEPTTTTAAPTTTEPESEASVSSDLGEFSLFGPGTYTMVELGIPVTFTVNENWHTQPVAPGFFVITTPETVGPGDHDLVFLRPSSLLDANREPTLAADDLDGWLATVPDTASVSEPTPTTVAGLDAVTFEVTVETVLPFLNVEGVVDDFRKLFTPGFLFEVVWIDLPDGQPIVVVVGTPEDDPGWLDVARDVVATLEIG